MKPPPFDYYAPSTVDEALAMLAEHPDSKLLAGGQSLMPAMKLRLARPAVLIDLNRIADLAYLRDQGNVLAVGAMTRTFELEESPLVSERCPMLAEAARHVGNRAIRHRGTVGGSLAHADPGADLPVAALALDAQFIVQGLNGSRSISADDFFVTYFTTTLAPGEILVEVQFKGLRPGTGWAFTEFSRRSGDFALAAVAVLVDRDPQGSVADARITLGGVGDRPIRCQRAEAVLAGKPGVLRSFAAAAEAAVDQLHPETDIHGTGEFRRKVAQTLVERALEQAWERSERSSAS